MGSCTVGGVYLPDGPYMIGAGVAKNPLATEKWLGVAPVVSGSYTPEPRSGNDGRVSYPDTLEDVRRLGYGLNSFGMPNMGFAAAAKELSTVVSEQPLIVSVAGFSVGDYVAGYQAFSTLESVTAIELNLGCPNTQGEHPDIMSFNPLVFREILERLARYWGTKRKPIWVKFSPFSNPAELKRMSALLNDFTDNLRLAVVTCNTFPFAYAGKGKIDPSHGRAGLSGPALKHIALGQVHQFREHLDANIDVIGVGGVMQGNDIMEFLAAGATAVQMTSWPFWAGDPLDFMTELADSRTSSLFLDHLTQRERKETL